MKKSNKTDGNWSHRHDYPIDEIWNTNNALARLIEPRLRAFLALDKHGFPVGFADMREWNNAIRLMADAFGLMSTTRTLTKKLGSTFSANIIAIYGINNNLFFRQ